MIVDTHVYSLPLHLTKRDRNLAFAETPIWESIFEHPEGEAALAQALPEAICRELEGANVEHCALISFPWNSLSRCASNNTHNLALAKQKGFDAICSINANSPDWKHEADRVREMGAVGLKVNPGWQGGAYSETVYTEVAQYCHEEKLLLMTHVDHPFQTSGSTPNEFVKLVENAPNTVFIAAHMGGMIGSYALLPRYRELFSNVFFDTAVSATLQMVKAYMDFGLEDQVLMGSDYPFNHSHSIHQVVDDLTEMLPDEQRHKVLSANYQRMLDKLR